VSDLGSALLRAPAWRLRPQREVSLTSACNVVFLRILNLTMVCSEYNRLRQHYEASLRHWGQVLLSAGAEPIGATARLAAEVRQKALLERDAANDRMCLHKQTCSVCNPKLRASKTLDLKRLRE
jgi:hypothetical protein